MCRMLLLLVLSTLLCTVVFAQVGGIIQSVSTYSNLAQSPLANQGAGAVFDVSPTENIVAIRFSLPVNLQAGVTNVVLELGNVPPPGTSYSFPQNGDGVNQCQGVSKGTDCLVLQNKLIVSFETTPLYATQQMYPRAGYIPYAYDLRVNTDILNNCTGNQSTCRTLQSNIPTGSSNPFFSTTMQCGAINDVNSFLGVDAQTTRSVNGDLICPATLSSNANAFYYPPSAQYMSTSGSCAMLYCAVPTEDQKDVTWSVSTPLTPGSMCQVNDMDPQPSALMMVSAFVSTVPYNNQSGTQQAVTERLDFSTSAGSILQTSATAPVAFSINRFNTPQGIIANGDFGLIVTCGVGGIGNTFLLNDMPPRNTSNTTYSIKDLLYNPWTANNKNVPRRCTLPVEVCRRMFLSEGYLQQVNDKPGVWYFVPPRALPGYGNGCNQNGANAETFARQSVVAKFCAQTDISSGVSLACIPGYPQLTDATGLGSDQSTDTPCEAMIDMANYLAASGASADLSDDPVDVGKVCPAGCPMLSHVPLSWNPARPTCWVYNNEYICETAGGNGGGGTLDMIGYFGASYLGTVTTVSTGKFTQTGMSCDATTTGGGSVTWTTQNTGRLGGEFLVAAQFALDEVGASSANIQYSGFDQLVINGNELVHAKFAQWGPQGSAAATVNDYGNYLYNGPYGNSLRVQLRLLLRTRPDIPTSTDYLQVDSVTVSCTITEGVINSYINHQKGQNASGFIPQGYDPRRCHTWFEWIGLCNGDYDKTYMLVLNLMAVIVTGLVVLFDIVAVILSLIMLPFIHSKKVKIDSDLLDVVKESNGYATDSGEDEEDFEPFDWSQ